MPTALVSSLAAPIRRVQALVGPGLSGDPAAEVAAELGGIHNALADVASSAGQAWRRTAPGWSGAGADAAAEFAATTARAIDDAAERAAHLESTTERAAEAVARAHRRLQAIVDEFEVKASVLERNLDSPGVAEKLLAEARRSLAEAIAVVEELLAELDGHAAALETAEPDTVALTGSHSAAVPARFNDSGAGVGSDLGGDTTLGTPAAAGGSSGGFADPGGVTGEGGHQSADGSMFGEGIAVRLPDGTVVMAPNPVAAKAVRHALTQLGVPYHWGGTTPDVGLDCSGLTQWAYGEAGMNIPRLAQEQDIGAPVAAGALRPGDLAVWDGHVAMVVGNGMMIEAGDPVMLSPIRTTNAGQGFQGFWRPTA